MPALPADALHPLRTCTDCKRVMVKRNYSPAGGLPEGLVRFHGKSRCYRCFHAGKTAERLAKKAADTAAREQAQRARFEANSRALEAYYAGRKARKRRAARRQALAARLSTGLPM